MRPFRSGGTDPSLSRGMGQKIIRLALIRAEQRKKSVCVPKDLERKRARAIKSGPDRGRRANTSTLFRPEPQPISPIHSQWSFGFKLHLTSYRLHQWLGL